MNELQVLLHEATLRLMTGANPSSHARYSLRCRRRLNASVTSSLSASLPADDDVSDEYQIYDDYDDDEDDEDDDESVVYDRKTMQDCRNGKHN